MKFESDGILISVKPFGERDVIAKFFSRDCGMLCGMIKGGAKNKKNPPLVGCAGHAVWTARLDSQLGALHWEIGKNLSIKFLNNSELLSFMNSAFALLDVLVPEREIYTQLYDDTIDLLYSLGDTGDMDEYLKWEINLLAHLGYAVDLSHCSGCGGTTNLNFLSPRTARAVCDKCAQPYLDKLYRLPMNLNTTMRFLENICAQQGIALPYFRKIIK